MRLYKPIMIGTVVSSLILLGFVSKNIIELNHDYNDTVYWKRANRTPIATLDTNTLYLDDTTKKKISEYIVLKNKIWDSNTNQYQVDGRLSDFKRFQEINNELPDHLKTTNADEIIQMWNLKDSYDKIVVNDVVSADIDFNTISTFLTNNYPILQNILLSDGQHVAADEFYQKLNKLTADFNQMTIIMKYVQDDYHKTTDGITTDMLEQHVQALQSEIEKLQFKWSSITVLNNVVRNSQLAVDSNKKSAERYTAYLNDQDQKDKFNKYVSDYNDKLTTLKNSVIAYPNFQNKGLGELNTWALNNGISISYTYKDSTDKDDIVLEQTPKPERFDKIVKGTTISVTIAKLKKVEQKQSTEPSKSSSSEDESVESRIVRFE